MDLPITINIAGKWFSILIYNNSMMISNPLLLAIILMNSNDDLPYTEILVGEKLVNLVNRKRFAKFSSPLFTDN